MPDKLDQAHLDTLQAVSDGQQDLDRKMLQRLVDGKFVAHIPAGGFQVTAAGRERLRLARSFGDAVADALVPGAGTVDSLRP